MLQDRHKSRLLVLVPVFVWWRLAMTAPEKVDDSDQLERKLRHKYTAGRAMG